MESHKNIWNAATGFLLSIPASIIIGAGMLSVAGFSDFAGRITRLITPQSPVLHPALVLGGLAGSIVLNTLPVFRVAFHPQSGVLVTTITTRLKLHNIAVAAYSAALLCAILLYAFAENFRIVAR